MIVLGVFIAFPGSFVAFVAGASIAGSIAAAASMAPESTQAFMMLAGCLSWLATVWLAADIFARAR